MTESLRCVSECARVPAQNKRRNNRKISRFENWAFPGYCVVWCVEASSPVPICRVLNTLSSCHSVDSALLCAERQQPPPTHNPPSTCAADMHGCLQLRGNLTHRPWRHVAVCISLHENTLGVMLVHLLVELLIREQSIRGAGGEENETKGVRSGRSGRTVKDARKVMSHRSRHPSTTASPVHAQIPYHLPPVHIVCLR